MKMKDYSSKDLSEAIETAYISVKVKIEKLK